jgi:transglutaminase-like putative cysteine protease
MASDLKRVWGLFFALLAFAQTLAAANQYDVGPAPKWAEVVAAPTGEQRSAEANGGTEYLLNDVQERLDKVASRYHHYVSRVVNTAGVDENAQVTVRFYPKLEKLHVHSVQVIRNGKAIDELRLGRIRVLQQEDELDDNVINGGLLFHLLLSDLRVGDVIDYSYTIDQQEPAWQGKYSGSIGTQWTTPVARVRSRILLPANDALFFRAHPEMAPQAWEKDGFKYYEWNAVNSPAVAYEQGASKWFQQFGSIEYSQFQDWSAVVRTALPLFEVKDHNGGELKDLIERFTKLSDDPQVRIMAAMRFVQDDIRYTGIEEGIGAYRPTAPREVLARRFGDCKDKTLLAVTLLRALGIDAVPALVSTHWRAETRNRLPGPHVMNHAIVRANFAGRTYWFDATATGQGGSLSTVWQASFGWALPIVSGAADLQAMPEPNLAAPLKRVTSTIDLSRGKDKPVDLKVTTVYLSGEADTMRLRLRADGTEPLAKDYLDYYQDQFVGVTRVAPLKVTDDRDLDQLTIEETYTVEKVFKEQDKGASRLQLEPDLIDSYLKIPDLKRRTTPYVRPFPVYVSEDFEVLLPGDWDMSTGKQKIHSSAFDYSSDISFTEQKLKIRYEYKSLGDHVDAKDFQEFLKSIRMARKDAGYSITDHGQDSRSTVFVAPATPASGGDFRNVKLIALFCGLFIVIQGLRRVRRNRTG